MNNHIAEHDVGASPTVVPEQYHRPRPTSYKDKYDHVRARYDHAVRTRQEYLKAYDAAHAKQSSLQDEIDCLVDFMLARAPPPSAQAQPPPAPPPRAFYPPVPIPAAGSSAAQHANGGSNGADDTNGHSSKRQRRA